MATSIIRFLGLLFTMGSLSATAQSPQAPTAPLDQSPQKPSNIGQLMPLSQQRDIRNLPSVGQIMVLLTPASKSKAQSIYQWEKRLSDGAGVPLKHFRLEYVDDDGRQIHVFKLTKLMTTAEAEDVVMRIRHLPGVKHADIDGGSLGDGFAAQPSSSPVPQEKARGKRSEIGPPVPLSQPALDISHIPHVDHIAVRLKGADSNRPRPIPRLILDKIIATSSSTPLTFDRTDGGEVHIFSLPRKMLEAEVEEIAARIRLLPDVRDRSSLTLSIRAGR